MSMMVSFVLSFFPRDVLDEILNLIESVSEGFPSYSFVILIKTVLVTVLARLTKFILWANEKVFLELSTVTRLN